MPVVLKRGQDLMKLKRNRSRNLQEMREVMGRQLPSLKWKWQVPVMMTSWRGKTRSWLPRVLAY